MATRPKKSFMQQAIAAAIEGVRSGEGGPFGAIVVRGGEVLAIACNRVTSRMDPTAHAEVEAIRAACAKLGTYRLDGCDIYASCEPCPMCYAAACWARVDRVIYACDRADAARAGFDDAKLHVEIEKRLAERNPPLVPFLREEGLAAFRDWLEKGDRIPY
jgi:guanine deaminase